MNYEEYKKSHTSYTSSRVEPKCETVVSPLSLKEELALVYFPTNNNDNAEDVWSLIPSYPEAILYASPRFREDLPLVVEGLVRSQGRSYKYLPPTLKSNFLVALCAFKFDCFLVKEMPNELFTEDFCSALLKHLAYFLKPGSVLIPISAIATIENPVLLMQKILSIEEKISNSILEEKSHLEVFAFIQAQRSTLSSNIFYRQ